MKLSNLFKSLTWKSVSRRSARKPQHRRASFSQLRLTFEALEERQVLSGFVNVVQSGNSLTITADANGTGGSTPTFQLHRISPTTVQVDSDGTDTLIAKNGAFGSASDTKTFTIGSVKNVTVNLGSGYDTFYMFDLSTSGNVVINGRSAAAGGALGQDIEIFNDSANMVIGGSIIENLGLQTGTEKSEYDIDAAHGFNLTVKGSIVFTDAGSGVSDVDGNADRDIEIYSDESGGNLLVKGAITIVASGTGTGDTFFTLQSEGGTTTVNGPVTVVQSGSTDMSFQITTEDGGSLLAKGPISYAASGTGSATLKIETGGGGGGDDGEESFGAGSSITLNSSVTAAFSGSGDHTTNIAADEDGGPISIKGSVTAVNSGTGISSFKIEADANFPSPILIKGSVAYVDKGSGSSEFAIQSDTDFSPITINGNVTYNNSANTVGHSEVLIEGSTDEENASPIVTIKGALTLLLSNAPSTKLDANENDHNSVYLGEDEGDAGTGYGLIVGGLTSIVGGPGQDKITLAEGRFNRGAVINTGTSPSSDANDFLEIDGSLFGGAVVITMVGPNAVININNGGGFQTTEFKGDLTVTMPGDLPSIFIADGPEDGNSPVIFDGKVIVVGRFDGGGVFEYDPDQVTFVKGKTLKNFTEILS